MRRSANEDQQFNWYLKSRYLSHLSNDELSERARHLLEAWTELSVQGKVSLGRPEEHKGNRRLIVNIMHVNFESYLRGYPESPTWIDAAIPKTGNISQQRLQEVSHQLSKYKNCLFKFGSKEFLDKLSFKVSLASSFADKSLNPAQRDNELSRSYRPHPNLGSSPFFRGSYEKPILERYRINSSFDYYVFCLSRRAGLRMFGDFSADAVLIIKDKRALEQGLTSKLKKEVNLSGRLSAPVSYYDDVRDTPSGNKPPELAKHFRFFYQQEHRIAFLPKTSDAGLKKDVIFELPELRETTELLTLQ